MKAKEIIKLYEDEEELANDEIAKLINNYFIKKCKSIGMEIEFTVFSSPSSALLRMALPSSFDVSHKQKYFKQYIKKVSDIIKKNNIKMERNSSSLAVYLPYAVSPLWINNDIFYLSVDIYNLDVVVQIRKSYSLTRAELKHKLVKYEEFSSELKLSEVYRLIDIMVKAIRLTPLEIEAGNES